MMIACCDDGMRPVIFKIERIDIPKTDEEQEWLASPTTPLVEKVSGNEDTQRLISIRARSISRGTNYDHS